MSLIHIWTKKEVGALRNQFKPSSKIFLLTIPRRRYSLKFCYFHATFFPNCNSLGPLWMYIILNQSFFHMFTDCQKKPWIKPLRSLPIAITVTLNHQGRWYLVAFDYDKVWFYATMICFLQTVMPVTNIKNDSRITVKFQHEILCLISIKKKSVKFQLLLNALIRY